MQFVLWAAGGPGKKLSADLLCRVWRRLSLRLYKLACGPCKNTRMQNPNTTKFEDRLQVCTAHAPGFRVSVR